MVRYCGWCWCRVVIDSVSSITGGTSTTFQTTHYAYSLHHLLHGFTHAADRLVRTPQAVQQAQCPMEVFEARGRECAAGVDGCEGKDEACALEVEAVGLEALCRGAG